MLARGELGFHQAHEYCAAALVNPLLQFGTLPTV